MPPAEKKWDANAERDLCVAIIMGAQDGERMRYNWPKVHSSMEALGYGFTKDAISQHFSKTIMREFKNRHGEPSANNSPAPTPTPKKTPRKRATPAKGRKKKTESDDEDEEAAVESPLAKKMKRKKEEEDEDVKMGNINSTEGGRDSSATPEGDDKFNKWLASDAAAKA